MVTAFDAHRGLGEITDGQGWKVPFHCTAIAGGSRTIEVGTAVSFAVRPGLLGSWEAALVEPLTRPG